MFDKKNLGKILGQQVIDVFAKLNLHIRTLRNSVDPALEKSVYYNSISLEYDLLHHTETNEALYTYEKAYQISFEKSLYDECEMLKAFLIVCDNRPNIPHLVFSPGIINLLIRLSLYIRLIRKEHNKYSFICDPCNNNKEYQERIKVILLHEASILFENERLITILKAYNKQENENTLKVKNLPQVEQQETIKKKSINKTRNRSTATRKYKKK